MKRQKASLSVRVKKAWKRDKMLILMSLLPMAMIIVFKYFPMFGIVMAFERYSPRKGYFHVADPGPEAAGAVLAFLRCHLHFDRFPVPKQGKTHRGTA